MPGIEISKCCGCGACADVCEHHAIGMRPDEEGFLYPAVDEGICMHCGRCDAVCPVLNGSKVRIPAHNISVYGGYFADADKLKRCASGGAATAISESFIDLGGVVCGVAYGSGFTSARFAVAQSMEELDSFKGSKYIQSEKGDIYSRVREMLCAGRTVLFIGLPCEVGALKTFLQGDHQNLYTVELICQGPTSAKVAEEYVRRLEQKHRGRVVDFSVRYKKDGWVPFHIRAVFEDGDCFLEPFVSSDYGHAFSILGRPSCYSCTFKGDDRVADVTVGDFWGASPSDVFYNRSGVSVLFIHTEKGRKLLEGIRDFSLFQANLGKALEGNPMIGASVAPSPKRETFSYLFRKKGLRVACRRTGIVMNRLKSSFTRKVSAVLKPLSRCH